MTSILEPFLHKKNPNETGTVSVYANVNKSNSENIITSEGITSSDGSLSLKFIQSSTGYDLILINNETQTTLFSLDELGNITLSGNLTLSNGDTSINRVVTSIPTVGNDNSIATTKSIKNYVENNVVLKSNIVQEQGTSITDIMSQYAVSTALTQLNDNVSISLQDLLDQLNEKISTDNIVQTTGTSTTDIMSQAAVTNAISSSGGGLTLVDVSPNIIRAPTFSETSFAPLEVTTSTGFFATVTYTPTPSQDPILFVHYSTRVYISDTSLLESVLQYLKISLLIYNDRGTGVECVIPLTPYAYGNTLIDYQGNASCLSNTTKCYLRMVIFNTSSTAINKVISFDQPNYSFTILN